jgi:hypothetical protein
MPGARQMIALVITFRKCNKKSLERRAGCYRSSSKRNTLYLEICYSICHNLTQVTDTLDEALNAIMFACKTLFTNNSVHIYRKGRCSRQKV